MVVDIPMPSLGLTMTEGRVVHWLKAEGDLVEEGQPLFELETEKATLEINAAASGKLTKILLPAGETAPVGQVIAVLETAQREREEGAIGPNPPGSASQAAQMPSGLEPGFSGQAQPAGKEADKTAPEKARITPVARRLAQEAGISLSGIRGSGPQGTITREDVEAAIAQARAMPQKMAEEIQPLSGIRAIIAQRMAESARTTASVSLSAEADATELASFREGMTRDWLPTLGYGPSYTDILVALLAVGLTEFPQLNAHLIGNDIHTLHSIHVGVAVDSPRGLVVPVIRDAAEKSLAEIARSSRDLIARARSGGLLPDELSGSTFTLTNLGMYGIDFFTPIINLPETAVLGVGRIAPTPSVFDGKIEIRKKATLSLTFDHRVVDGAPAARFLQRIVQLIEQVDRTLIRQR